MVSTRPVKSETVRKTYSQLKKGRLIDCLGCARGKVMPSKGIKDCSACKGKGVITVT